MKRDAGIVYDDDSRMVTAPPHLLQQNMGVIGESNRTKKKFCSFRVSCI